MASASMRPRRCSTPPPSTSWPVSPARPGRLRAGRQILLVAENEPQETRLVRPAGGRRVRPRRALERRLPPFRACRSDRSARSLLPRLPGRAAGVRLGGAIRLSFPGAAVRLAGRAARHAGPLAAADRLRHLPREPRPGRQLGARPAAACAGEPRAAAGADGAAPAVAADPDAVPGTGVLGFRAVSLLRRSRPRACPQDRGRPRRVRWRSSPACGTRRRDRGSQTPRRRRPSSAAAWTGPRWTSAATFSRSTATSCGSVARPWPSPEVGARKQSGRRVGPRPRGAASAVLRGRARRRTAVARQPRRRPTPSQACRTRSSPRRPEPTGTCSGRARTRRMAEAAGAESKPPGASH